MNPQRCALNCCAPGLVSRTPRWDWRLAWEKGLELEHLSVCSSQNTNPLKNKRKKVFQGQQIWKTVYTQSPHTILEIYTTIKFL